MPRRVYIASPYGFTDSGRYFAKHYFIPKLSKAGIEVLDPWKQILDKRTLELITESREMGREAALNLGRSNAEMIRRADAIVAVLEGSDVDSGVAAEIGYAFGIGKRRIFGYLADYRISRDALSCSVNLQVETFIVDSGGAVYSDLDDLVKALLA